MQQTLQALQAELDSLRADNIKLYEKIKFLQSYPGRVRRRPDLGFPRIYLRENLKGGLFCAVGRRQRRHGDALLIPV